MRHTQTQTLLAAVLVCCSGMAFSYAPQDTPGEANARRITGKINGLNKTIADLEQKLAANQGKTQESARLQQQLNQASSTAKQYQTELNRINSQLKKATSDQAKADADKKTALDQLSAMQTEKAKLEAENRQLRQTVAANSANKNSTLKDTIVVSPIKDKEGKVTVDVQTRFNDPFKNGRGQGPDMIWLPEVLLGKAFAMGRTEVTVKEYLLCVNDGACREPEWREVGNKYHHKTGSSASYYVDRNALDERSPITGVNWHDAKAYVTWLSNKTQENYKLPNENEWEKACLAGANTTYCGSSTASEVAWIAENSGGKLHAVASIGRGVPYGLFDMTGNVWEWTENCANSDCKTYAARGGCWVNDTDHARAAGRNSIYAGFRSDYVGFRVARTAR